MMEVEVGGGKGAAELLTLLGIQVEDLDWRQREPEQRADSTDFKGSGLIKKLSRLIMEPEWTEVVANTFPALLGSVLEYSCRNGTGRNTVHGGSNNTFKFNMTVALGKLIRVYPSALGFSVTWLSTCGSPLSCLSILVKTSSASLSKKPKRQQTEFTIDDAAVLLESVLIMLKVLPVHIYREWQLKSFLELSKLGHKKLTWFGLQCIGMILSLSDADLQLLMQKYGIDSSTHLRLGIEFQSKFEARSGFRGLMDSNNRNIGILLPEKGIVKFPEALTSIGGTLVKTGSSTTTPLQGNDTNVKLVHLDSTVSYIREIAVLLSSKFLPICLVGPIGCGKSSLIKYTASLFGRQDYPHVISIQMSDQIDSRLLLGSYHSTDLPGQFLWKPGSLTKAVLRGHWIILEDVDSAPSDVIALFDGLIDTHKLSVPGYGEIESIHPDFRVFATYRTQTGKRGVKLGKQWRRIFVESLTSEEMKTLMSELFPYLRPLADRLIAIYGTVAAFQSDLSGRNGRAVSLRDFLKFCRRIPATLDFTQTHAAIVIFQEACDLFINSFPNPETRQEIAELVGTQLNLLRAKAEYFCTTYKPHINICTNSSVLTAGRYSIPMFSTRSSVKREELGVFSLTKRACNLMEILSGSISNGEPVLLIGETGVGKTSCVQYLANVLHQKLIVVNLNRQSDSGDLLGGYKPVELKYIFSPIREEFEALFVESFSQEANSKFLGHIMTCYANRRWRDLVRLMIHVQKSAVAKFSGNGKHSGKTEEFSQRWGALGHQLARIDLQISNGEESPFAFSFIEGTLITAIKNGYWILLDEINLATPEMLQCLSGILEEDSDVHLWEKGDESPIKRHPKFHLFAAMNPSTDVGKKDLPLGLRNRFTEVFVEELTDPAELQVLVSDYLKEMALSSVQIEKIVEFYLKVKSLSQSTLVDGMGKKPHFSLRTLCRALKISSMNIYGSVNRSLYESFCLSFLTQLDYSSHPVVQSLVATHIFGKVEIKSILNQALPCPTSGHHVQIEGYWIPKGDREPQPSEKYILTPSIRRNLKDLARIVSAGRLPVLIQGETSVGKTSLIQYFAQLSGNNCYRINNHQHTDLQEYIGSYQSDQFGKLVFTEGILVTAMRRGEWIILDELNLAPSEVLEALNRLLDDNRQLFITETGQTITAHPRFVLFATQNPPGLYGGRKVLSRAFRNRFIELHFDEIPSAELETILHHRCNIPASYCKKIIGVLRELQMRRKASAALEGKHGFATLRDLFRWAERYRQSGEQTTTFYDWDQHLADEGYLVLAGKVRKSTEAQVIREVLQKHLKRTVDPNNLFSLHENTSSVTRSILETICSSDIPEFRHIVWTFQMRRLAVLIGSSLKFREPILLVGETGGGKTSIVQLLAHLYAQRLFTVNCHMHSEGSDFLGGLRPVRNHQENESRLFEWVNGPLVDAMEVGGIFLADEISLADDSVLERINSVLEPERTLLLSEKGDETPKLVVANDKFHFIGTMNPGGDYGKKELSPALRNRLTEIWCEVSSDSAEIEAIVEHNLLSSVKGKGIARIMTGFVAWLKNNELGSRCTISIRDYLTWTQFINSVIEANLRITLAATVKHGACLAFLDGLGSGTTATENVTVSQIVKCQAMDYLGGQTSEILPESTEESSEGDVFVSNTREYIGIGPFFIKKKMPSQEIEVGENTFNLEAPTTSQNALRVLRAMQLKKPILLEGSPGVGKTALITALGKICHRPVVRINLSEQTDISDLFGADLPVEGATGGHFEWRDGPLLQALKASAWILLDELNLASQSVLEGLNACLDHRGEVFVPELNRTFRVGSGQSQNRIFGCQNPVRQGGARKGLPRSFLNRFTQVFMDPLSVQDLQWIMQTTFNLPERWISVMSGLGDSVVRAVCQLGLFGNKGSPWDFNLRDLIRWASLVEKKSGEGGSNNTPSLFVDFIYGMRMRTAEDSDRILQLFEETCKQVGGIDCELKSIIRCGQSGYTVTGTEFHCGSGRLQRVTEKPFPPGGETTQLLVLQKQLPALEALTLSLEMGWMPILVGPSKSGKTSVVKLLAELTGHSLQIMTVSPEMDTIELLGGFEQADIYRKIDETTRSLSLIVEQVVKSIVRHKGHNLSLMDLELLDLWSSLHSLQSLVSDGKLLAQEEEMSRIEGRLNFLQRGFDKCRETFLKTPREISAQDLQREVETIEDELEKIRTQLKAGIRNGAFQWVDSILVKAIRSGDWLLIDGANRCTAAVLDRLNSLMELNGSLFLSERGSIDGNIIEMKPHVNFRLILTMDPAFGEISRAMRNRGVEIYMPGPEEISAVPSDAETCLIMEETNDRRSLLDLTSGGSKSLSPPAPVTYGINWFDLDALCRAEGLAHPGLRRQLVNLHERIYATLAPSLGIPDRPHIYQIIETVRMLGVELRHGTPLSQALQNSLSSVYLKGNLHFLDEELRKEIELLLGTFEPQLDFSTVISNCPLLPVSVPNYINSQLYRVWKESDILMTAFQTPSIIPILGSINRKLLDEELLENLLFLTPFLRIGKSDFRALTGVFKLKFPKFKTEVGMKLYGILESWVLTEGMDGDLPWDPQWKPHFLAKYPPTQSLPGNICEEIDRIVQTSLQLHAHLFKSNENGEDWKNGTFGSLARIINQGKFLHENSFQSSKLFSNSWSLLEKFDGVLLRGLRGKRSINSRTLKSWNDYGSLWLRGMGAYLWRFRLFTFAHSPYDFKNRNEKLNSNLILIIQWIGDDVVPYLTDLDPSIGAEMKTLVTSCLDQADCDGENDKALLEVGKSFRKASNTKPFSVTTANVNFLEEILELCFSGWSLSTTVNPRRLVPFLKSREGEAHSLSLTELFSTLINQSFTQGEIQVLEELKSTIQKLKEAKFETEELEDLEALKQNVTGLVEYIRIQERGKNSPFMHPLLQINYSGKQSSLTHYLWWEEEERFRSLFLEQPNYELLTTACLLPYFVSKIVIEQPGTKYRVATLGSREVVAESMETVAGILSRKLTSPVQNDKVILDKLAANCCQLLQQLMPTSSDGSIKEQFLNIPPLFSLEEQMAHIGTLMLKFGLELMNVGSRLPIVDPAVESEILVGYLAEEIKFFETWVTAQRIYELTATGVDIANSHSNSLHPSLLASLDHLKILYQKLTEAKKFQAFRPDPPNYQSIRQDLRVFSKSFLGSPEAIKKFNNQVIDIFQGRGKEESIQDTVTSCQIWIDAHRNFTKKMFRHFWYWDISAGFLCASVQASIGLTLISKALNRFKLGPNKAQKKELQQLIEFPLQFRDKEDAFNNCILSKEVFESTFTQSIYTASLISFVNEIETEGYASTSTILKLHDLSSNIARIWTFQEEEKQKAKELEDAMYVFKGKERSMGLTEDEQEALDVSNTFPDYVEDLIDLEVQNLLEGGTTEKRVGQERQQPKVILTPEDVALFLKIHHRVMNQVKTHWISGKEGAVEFSSDFVTPFLIRFQHGSAQFKEFHAYLGKMEENKFVAGASVATHNLRNNYEQPDFFRPVQIYDFYHDMNINEVHRLSSVLNGLKKRVKELLQEWADHPSLLKILEVVGRIESFRIDSALMRFLTCLELLLSTSQEWESCAHQGVSISLYLSEITEIIISWRKLELQCWKNLLEIIFQKEQAEVHKWWFHLYSSVMEIVNSPVKKVPSEFLGNLHHFMESSSLGQFQTRLSYLYNIHCHLITMEQNYRQTLPDYLQPYIWNTLNYYKQFQTVVSAKLTSLRSPIEKKMKDFVKISRWNDSNYYALKDSVQKNQRMLNKFVKEWKKAMLTPVSSVLVADLSGVDTQDKLWKRRAITLKPKLYLANLAEVGVIRIPNDLPEILNVKRLARLSKIFIKTQKVIKPVLDIESVSCAREIEAVEELTGTIIEDVHELQIVEVTEKSGEKRRKMLHNIHFRKRASLADLFKVLQQLNISYRRGLVQLTSDEKSGGKLHRNFSMHPIDVGAGWKVLAQEFPADIELGKCWEGCELYFQKCLSRMAVMMKSFESPSKELGPRIIERCKGVVADLLTIAATQKEFIADFTRNLWTLRNLTQHNYSQGQCRSDFEEVYQESCRIEYTTRQLKLCVETLGTTPAETRESISNVLSGVLLHSDDVKNTLKIYVDSVPLQNLREKLMEGRIDLIHSVENFQKIADSFRSIESDTILGLSFREMAESIEGFVMDRIVKLEELPPRNSLSVGENGGTEKFGKSIKQVLQNVLLTFQKLDKFKVLKEQVENGMSDPPNQTPVTNLKELLSKEMSSFEIQRLLNGILRLMRIMRIGNCTEFGTVFTSLTPLLHQYTLVAEFYLTMYVQFHRSTCKLLSVLLGIFATLGSKGFCLPADYEDDAVAEGQEMDASAGMGMGEGETTSDAQDVSDRMESEDQLEDTLKEGETAPSAEKDLNDDEKGVEMSEDFEGKQQDKDEREGKGDEEDDKDDDSGSDEEELDKQMGDVDDPSADKLDDQMWGGSSDEEDENLNEKEEEQGKGSNRQSEPELRAKDPTLDVDAENEPEPQEQNEESKTGKEYNEQDDEEANDDQTDPYHGQNLPEEEPEDFDLPDDLNLDGAEPKDNEEVDEENALDLDAKEKDELTDVPEDDKSNEENIPDENQVSDEEDPEAGTGVDVEKPMFEEETKMDDEQGQENQEAYVQENPDEEGGMEVDEPEKEQKDEENLEDVGDAGTESEQKVDDSAEPSEVNTGKSQDQTSVANEKAKGEQVKEMDTTEEDKSKQNDETASGQAESSDGTGHEGKSLKEEKNQLQQQDKNQEDASRKPGDADKNRSLANDPKLQHEGANRLKTLDRPDETENEAEMDEPGDDSNNNEAELYQHVKDAERSDATTIDNSTREQAEKQKQSESEKKKEDDAVNPELEEEDAMDQLDEATVDELENHKPEKNIQGHQDKTKAKGELKSEKAQLEEQEIEMEGEKVVTYGTQRPADSLFETRLDLLEEWSREKEKMILEETKRQIQVKQNYLTSEEEAGSLSQWHELEGKTIHLAQELCEQLRLVLEPTQAARLKGDYKTGKRLNMRKVIPYIASGFRKDKIWLRRTQPSKREYQILLALDDSASMADNQSKQMAFSAVAVVARSLGLLEAGQLGVVGFGEDVQLLHPFEEPFTDVSGAKLIQQFSFAQRATRIAQLLDFSETLFEQAKESHSASSSLSPEVAQLLLIVSDGRGVSHEGSGIVKRAVRHAREKNIFIVFIVVDNPENKDSILDIRLPIFGKDGTLDIAKYMDHFPFPFYLILRDLGALPSVLSDALRQWFELVTSSER